MVPEGRKRRIANLYILCMEEKKTNELLTTREENNMVHVNVVVRRGNDNEMRLNRFNRLQELQGRLVNMVYKSRNINVRTNQRIKPTDYNIILILISVDTSKTYSVLGNYKSTCIVLYIGVRIIFTTISLVIWYNMFICAGIRQTR